MSDDDPLRRNDPFAWEHNDEDMIENRYHRPARIPKPQPSYSNRPLRYVDDEYETYRVIGIVMTIFGEALLFFSLDVMLYASRGMGRWPAGDWRYWLSVAISGFTVILGAVFYLVLGKPRFKK